MLTREDIAWIVAPLKGSAFLAAVMAQANTRRCDRCQLEISNGYLCRRCGALETPAADLARLRVPAPAQEDGK